MLSGAKRLFRHAEFCPFFCPPPENHYIKKNAPASVAQTSSMLQPCNKSMQPLAFQKVECYLSITKQCDRNLPPVQILGRLATICKSGRLRKRCFVKQTPEREKFKRRKSHEEVPFSGTGSGDDHVSGHRQRWCQGLHGQQQDSVR